MLASLQCIETFSMLTRTVLLGIIGRENSMHSNPIETVFNLIMIASTFLTAFLLSTFTSQRLQRELRHAARHDELTGLYNRRAFAELADREWLRGSRHMEEASMLMMDLDFFKSLNDRFGHQVGDIVLVETANAIQHEIRGEDICCRFGGEEFVAYLVDTNAAQAMALAERLRSVIADLHIPAIADFSLSISIGISARSADHTRWEDMITSADIALYQAKHEGRNRVCVYRPQNNTIIPA
jgi:diguanylate cyclase (GGDEF)-like protein